MLLLVSLYLGLVILLPLTLSVAVSYRTLPRGRCCPLCHSQTFLLQTRWLRLLKLSRAHEPLQRRWCALCGWEGLARFAGVPLVDEGLRVEEQPTPPAPAEDDEPVAALSVRRLEVDGRPWRVLLQLWPSAERWRGRLLFVGPTGQRCADALQPLDGSSPDELLGQARALPDVTLVGRVRALF